jgi:hypothetical protein
MRADVDAERIREDVKRYSTDEAIDKGDLAFLRGRALLPRLTDTADDLEVTVPYEDGGSTLLDSIRDTRTEGGRAALSAILERPTSSVTDLERRARALEKVRHDAVAVARALEDVAAGEAALVWLIRPRSEAESALHQMVFFNSWMASLNNFPIALQTVNFIRMFVNPIMTFVVPFLSILTPFLILRYRRRIPISFWGYMRLVVLNFGCESKSLSLMCFAAMSGIHFQNVMTSVEVAGIVRSINETMWRRCALVSRFCRGASKLTGAAEVAQAFGLSSTEWSLEMPECAQPFGRCSYIGRALAAIKAVDTEKIRSMMVGVYATDAVHSIVAAQAANGWCMPSFVESSRWPLLHLPGLKHPCIRDAVGNDLSLGDQQPNNALITGPNAGGKSTLMKATLLAAWMAQTVGVVAADEARITPFANILAHVHIPDCKGRESLFEAEMMRCRSTLAAVEAPGFTLTGFDEMFSSTEPVEGAAAAFAVSKRLACNERSVTVITTHYESLGRLAEVSDFSNYHMSVERADSGAITFPYRLVPGIGRQRIALELLAAKGFDRSLIEDAVHERTRLAQVCSKPAEGNVQE